MAIRKDFLENYDVKSSKQEVGLLVIQCSTHLQRYLRITRTRNPKTKNAGQAACITFIKTTERRLATEEKMVVEIDHTRIDNYFALLNEIRKKTSSDVIAAAVLQEVSKDRRSEEMNGKRSVRKNGPASESQKAFMDRLGIEYTESITKKEASRKIDEALEQQAADSKTE